MIKKDIYNILISTYWCLETFYKIYKMVSKRYGRVVTILYCFMTRHIEEIFELKIQYMKSRKKHEPIE